MNNHIKSLINRERAAKLLSQKGFGGIIATTSENIHYILGVPLRTTNWEMQIYALLPKDQHKKIALIMPTNRLFVLAQKGIPDVDIYLHSPFYIQEPTVGAETTTDIERFIGLYNNTKVYEDPITALLTALHDKELQNEDIAIDEMRFNPRLLEQLKSEFPKKVEFGYKILRDIRLVKTKEEINRLENVANLNESAEKQLIQMIKVGVHEAELAHYYRKFMVENHAIPSMVAVGGGPRSALALIEEYFYKLRQGDLVRFDLCTQLNGYWADTGRTAVLGKPNKWQCIHYSAITKGWEHALSLMKPGEKLSNVFYETVNVVRKSGIPHYRRQHVGHSIGLELYDDMVISGADNRIIEKDMVFCLEVPYYELGAGGFQIEDTIVITEDGYKFLTKMDRRLFVV